MQVAKSWAELCSNNTYISSWRCSYYSAIRYGPSSPTCAACLLRYFDSVAQQVLGFHHPLATSLRLVKEDTLFDSAEPVLRLMLDIAKEADILTSLLTRQGKFLSAMDVCQDMIADDMVRKGHGHERVLLNHEQTRLPLSRPAVI